MKGLFRWLDVAAFLAFAGLLLFYYGRWSLRFMAGMAIAAAGFALWMVARRQLGSSFSPRAQAKALVTTGLYAKLSNPIYLFGQVAYLGLAIAWGSPAGFIFVAVTCVAQFLRIRKERTVLEQVFGENYRAYLAGTWF
jgi:protein-S-isoprenylcysteine O-methyltransferase Ste14